MRVAVVTSEYVTESLGYDGGTAVYTHKLVLLLMGGGVDVDVFVPSYRDEIFERDGCRIHRVKVRTIATRFLNLITGHIFSEHLFTYFTSSRLWRAVNACGHFDLIHTSSYRGISVLFPSKIPIVLRVSGLTRLCAPHESIASSAFGLRAQVRLEESAIRRADGVFAPSIVVADFIKKNIRSDMKVIETPFFPLPSSGIKLPERLRGRQYALFFGTLSALKGLYEIERILSSLLVKYPDLHFAFVGKDAGFQGRKFSERLLSAADKARDRVHIFGPFRQAELLPILKTANVVVLPSRFDNFPNTCLEAMALGKIVIGCYGASFEQLIDNGVSGFLCVPNSPTSLMETICRVMVLGDDEREAISRRAAQRVQECLPEVIRPKILDFYKQIIEKHAEKTASRMR